jgi:hypothetical protein
MNQRFTITIILASILFMMGCGGSHNEHHGLQSKLDAVSVDSIDYQLSTEQLLHDMKKVMAQVPDSSREFYIPERSSMIRSYPCTNCHSESLESLKGKLNDEGKKAHWDIELVHADANVMECTTCHDENNMNQLKTIVGKGISIDHSYQLCGQCHSTQYKDWVGGAHGKRLAGWVPPRVINGCVNCHSPHNPAFESRWPARLNTVKLKEQSSN